MKERDAYVVLLCFAIKHGNLASANELDGWLTRDHKGQFDYYDLTIGSPERAKINKAYKARKLILSAQNKESA